MVITTVVGDRHVQYIEAWRSRATGDRGFGDTSAVVAFRSPL
jgi:hypothetical protein